MALAQSTRIRFPTAITPDPQARITAASHHPAMDLLHALPLRLSIITCANQTGHLPLDPLPEIASCTDHLRCPHSTPGKTPKMVLLASRHVSLHRLTPHPLGLNRHQQSRQWCCPPSPPYTAPCRSQFEQIRWARSAVTALPIAPLLRQAEHDRQIRWVWVISWIDDECNITYRIETTAGDGLGLG